MIELIFSLVLMLCLGTVLYLAVTALPRIVDEPNTEKGFLERWAHSESLEKIDAWFNRFVLKFLRKIKVTILRMDNMLAKHLRRITPKESHTNTNIDFKEINGQNTEGAEKTNEVKDIL